MAFPCSGIIIAISQECVHSSLSISSLVFSGFLIYHLYKTGPLIYNPLLGLLFPIFISTFFNLYPNSGWPIIFNSLHIHRHPTCCVTLSYFLVNKAFALSSVYPYPSIISAESESLKKLIIYPSIGADPTNKKRSLPPTDFLASLKIKLSNKIFLYILVSS